jgi:hypothetical protein
MNNIINWIIVKTWKSDYFKAWVLAQARHAGTVAGTTLILHGLADKGMAEQISGFVVTAAMFYLANLDVRLVDGKIKIALLSTPTDPVIPVEIKPLEPIK